MTQEYVAPKEIKRCPIDNTFKIIGKKFTVHILRDMYMRNNTRFNQFLHTIEGVNSNTLAARLKEMEKGKLIKKRIYHETPIRIEYSLTDKGRDTIPILEQMAAFSLKHAPEIFVDKKTRSFQQVCGRNPASL
ncbi:helix-turn-helix domain-containing protein [Nitrosopumilus sp.]|uniref:winged helix-turn-helix transcriptional regulator n=1 Tax=Nitrosopumilus sp. TaxID=2024843 RepID=UPI00292D9B41|nr:helix-turn-helix domain-containing protein [Nitrosopumilus sp.]